jgi:hypothetical protein
VEIRVAVGGCRSRLHIVKEGLRSLPNSVQSQPSLMVRNHAACPDVPDTNTGTSRRVKDRKNCRAAGARACRRHMMIPA